VRVLHGKQVVINTGTHAAIEATPVSDLAGVRGQRGRVPLWSMGEAFESSLSEIVSENRSQLEMALHGVLSIGAPHIRVHIQAFGNCHGLS